MIYFGYCGLCNYADASIRYLDIYEAILDHQEKAHKRIEGDRIHILVSRLPFKVWLVAKRSPSFWHTWRNRNILKFPKP